jgi:Cu2+-containing amine oxidase
MNYLDINVDIMKGYNKMKIERQKKVSLDSIKQQIIKNKIFLQKQQLEKRNHLEEKKPEILEENIQNLKTPISNCSGYNIVRKGLVVVK